MIRVFRYKGLGIRVWIILKGCEVQVLDLWEVLVIRFQFLKAEGLRFRGLGFEEYKDPPMQDWSTLQGTRLRWLASYVVQAVNCTPRSRTQLII